MTSHEQREYALREADRMRMEASQMKQLGFHALARFLRKNADDAMRWAGAPYRMTAYRTSEIRALGALE